jgi:hypothetical protein
MKPTRDHIDALLRDAAVRTCCFDFEQAHVLARKAEAAGDGTHVAQAQWLLKAVEHNRSSYLFDLLRKHQQPRSSPSNRSGLQAGVSRCLLRGTRPPGRFTVRFKPKGMVVTGAVSDGSPMVHVFLNELLVASVKTAANRLDELRGIRRFSFRINTASLKLLPGRDKARLGISTGKEMLRHVGADIFYPCDWPAGEGGIEAAIMGGAILTAHREIGPPTGLATTRKWLATYDRVTAFMREAHGKPVFLYYGSLLGAVRDNAVIPHDDDFDVAYFSDKTSAGEIKQEMIEIIAGMVASDAKLTVRLMTFFFKVEVDGGIIDVFPAWHDGEHLWSPWSTCLDCGPDLLKELEQRDFHGRNVLVPARAEIFLALKYGEGWRTPDPAWEVKARPIEYPFRKIPFNQDDRSRIVEAARRIAGHDRIGTVEMRPAARSLKGRFKASRFGDLPRRVRARLGLQRLGRHS